MSNDGDRNYWEDWRRRRISRRTLLHRAGLAGLTIAGASALWACGQTETPKASEPAAKDVRPKRGGTLKVGAWASMQGSDMNIHTGFTGGSDMYLRPIWDTLVNFDERGEYKPELSLAESWESVDDVTILFKLRRGVKFQDGTEWNSEILKFNLDRIGNPKTKSPRAYVIDAMKSVEYPDNYTCTIVLKQPMASFLGEMAQMGMGMMTPTHVAKYSEQDLSLHPLGSGPFSLAEMKTDSHYDYRRFQDHWRKDSNGDQLPYLDGFKISIIPDATVRLANLKTGQIDVDSTTEMKDVAGLKADPNFKVMVRNTGVVGLYWNLSVPPFNNLNFRRACTYAINREAIVKGVTFGVSTPFVSFVLPAHAWVFDPNLPVPKYDPVKAKQYVDKALAEGVKPEFTNYSLPDEYMQASEMVQADLAKIGIKMNIVPETSAPARFFYQPHDIKAMMNQYSAKPDPYTNAYTAHHSHGTYTPEKRSAGPGWDTPEKYFARLDPLIESSNKTLDSKQRAKYLNDAAKLLADEVGWLGLYYRMSVITANKYVEGLYLGGDAKARFETTWLKS